MFDAANAKKLVEVRGLKMYFPIFAGVLRRHVGNVKAVDDVSFDIFDGETLGLVGESGCGKTVSSLSILKLLEMPPAEFHSGKIFFEGQDLLTLSEQQMRDIRGKSIKLGFTFPQHASVLRREIFERIQEENRAAAMGGEALADAMKKRRQDPGASPDGPAGNETPLPQTKRNITK